MLLLPLMFCLFTLFAAAAILPVVQKQHQLLVTLLLCNAAAMEVEYLDCNHIIITLFCTLEVYTFAKKLYGSIRISV
jgi:hypothetical protein